MNGKARQRVNVRSVAFTAPTLLTAIVVARADDSAIISRWYSALLVADRTELADLLADDVRIRLDDLGIIQGKHEFIASLDEWKGAVAGAAIRHRIEKSEGGVITVIACYDFPDNDMLMQETFAVTNNRITARRRRSPRTAMATEQAGRDIACDKPAPYIGGNPASTLCQQSAKDCQYPEKASTSSPIR